MTKEELDFLAALEGVDLAPQEVPEPPKRAPIPVAPKAAAAESDAKPPPPPRGVHGALPVTAPPRAVDAVRRGDHEFKSVVARLRRAGGLRRGI